MVDVLKKPEIVISSTTALAVVGLGIYTVKRLNDMSEKIEDLTDDLTKLSKKQGEVKPSDIQTTKANLDSLFETMRKVDGVIKNLYDSVTEIQENAEEDNEQLQDFIDSCSAYILSKDPNTNLPDVELSLIDEPAPVQKGRGRGRQKGGSMVC